MADADAGPAPKRRHLAAPRGRAMPPLCRHGRFTAPAGRAPKGTALLRSHTVTGLVHADTVAAAPREEGTPLTVRDGWLVGWCR